MSRSIIDHQDAGGDGERQALGHVAAEQAVLVTAHVDHGLHRRFVVEAQDVVIRLAGLDSELTEQGRQSGDSGGIALAIMDKFGDEERPGLIPRPFEVLGAANGLLKALGN